MAQYFHMLTSNTGMFSWIVLNDLFTIHTYLAPINPSATVRCIHSCNRWLNKMHCNIKQVQLFSWEQTISDLPKCSNRQTASSWQHRQLIAVCNCHTKISFTTHNKSDVLSCRDGSYCWLAAALLTSTPVHVLQVAAVIFLKYCAAQWVTILIQTCLLMR